MSPARLATRARACPGGTATYAARTAHRWRVSIGAESRIASSQASVQRQGVTYVVWASRQGRPRYTTGSTDSNRTSGSGELRVRIFTLSSDFDHGAQVIQSL